MKRTSRVSQRGRPLFQAKNREFLLKYQKKYTGHHKRLDGAMEKKYRRDHWALQWKRHSVFCYRPVSSGLPQRVKGGQVKGCYRFKFPGWLRRVSRIRQVDEQDLRRIMRRKGGCVCQCSTGFRRLLSGVSDGQKFHGKIFPVHRLHPFLRDGEPDHGLTHF